MNTSFGWEGKGRYGSFRYGCTRGVQVKLWDPLRRRAIPERLRGVVTTRCYANPRLLYLTSWSRPYCIGLDVVSCVLICPVTLGIVLGLVDFHFLLSILCALLILSRLIRATISVLFFVPCFPVLLSFYLIFTALHVMQTRYSDENSVCLSVGPSVCPSFTRVNCDKTDERSVQIFIPHER